MEQNQSYVFISYAHKDASVVLPCVEAMKQSGICLWYDEGIEAGSEWPEFIAEKVVGCCKFVLFVSDAYLDSQNCKRELNFAISRKKDILTVFFLLFRDSFLNCKHSMPYKSEMPQKVPLLQCGRHRR